MKTLNWILVLVISMMILTSSMGYTVTNNTSPSDNMVVSSEGIISLTEVESIEVNSGRNKILDLGSNVDSTQHIKISIKSDKDVEFPSGRKTKSLILNPNEQEEIYVDTDGASVGTLIYQIDSEIDGGGTLVMHESKIKIKK